MRDTSRVWCGAGAWLNTSKPAQAIREVQLPDGSTVFAYELDIDLKIVALRSSVPSDAILDFRRALSKYGRFQLAQKPQIADIFEELGQPRSAQSCGPSNCSEQEPHWEPVLTSRRCHRIVSACNACTLCLHGKDSAITSLTLLAEI